MFRMEMFPHPQPPQWPRPPLAIPAALLHLPPAGATVAVAGLVLVRQRPGTAKGVIFVTLEDETGVANVVVWAQVYETYRRAVISGRLLRVTGPVQRDGQVVHVIARRVEDLSGLLDELVTGPHRTGGGGRDADWLARADEVRRPGPETAQGRPARRISPNFAAIPALDPAPGVMGTPVNTYESRRYSR
jgi:hypothetical protein